MPMAGRKRGTCIFNDDLAREYPFIVKKAKFGNGTGSDVYCTICRRYFNIANSGRFQIKNHIKCQKHKEAVRNTYGGSETNFEVVVNSVGENDIVVPSPSDATAEKSTSNLDHHPGLPTPISQQNLDESGGNCFKPTKTSLKKASTISINIGHLPEDDDDISQLSKSKMEKNPVLIDTDGGIYDAWALLLALRAANANPGSQPPRNINIVGITTVNGCTTVENATRNVCHLLGSLLGQKTRPIGIHKGMDSPLTSAPGSKTERPSFFGLDGYGNAPDLPPAPEVKVQYDHAITWIIKMAEKYKGKLTIVCLGPLTNLAMAVKQKPEIRHYVKEIFIVGGNSEGIGNVTVASEFNFFIDPEAASIVLESFNLCPVFILPWETCFRSAALKKLFRTHTIANLGTSEVRLINKLEGNFSDKYGDQWIVPDAVLMGCFLNREMMRNTEHYHCTVEVQGKHARGMMIVDKNFVGKNPANVTLITEVSRRLFGKMIIWALGGESLDLDEVIGNGEDSESTVSLHNIKLERVHAHADSDDETDES